MPDPARDVPASRDSPCSRTGRPLFGDQKYFANPGRSSLTGYSGLNSYTALELERHRAIDLLLWAGALAVLSILGVPWAFVLCRSLPSRGVLLAAPVGLFLAHYLAWLGLSTGFFPNGRGVAVAALLTFAALSAALAWRLSPSLVELRSNRRLWSAGCLLLLAMFAVGVGLRWLNPEIGGTEKPMDFALLNAAARATAFPPPDPWFAGETVNYYYLGYSMAAFGMHLSGADPAVGYNLAVATLFALGALAAASAGYDLAVLTGAGKRARTVAAALALGLTMLAGNLAVLRVIFSDSTDTPTGFWQGIGWNASRTIQREDASGLTDYTINEFPAFSFILGDLHPHVMALPFTLLAVSLAVQWILAGVGSEREALALRLARGALTGLVLGGLYALNAWDAPTFAGLVLAGGVVVAWRDRRRLLALAPPAAAALFVGIVAWLPYTLNYVPGSRGIGVVTVRSEAIDYFQVFGLLLIAAVVTLAVLLWDARPDGRLFLIVLLAAGAGGTVIARGDIVVGLAALLILSAFALWSYRAEPGLAALLWLLVAGLGLLTVVEALYVDDFFGSPNERMNTVFKVHYQAWGLLAIAAGPGLILTWRRLTRPDGLRLKLTRTAFVSVLALLAIPALVYPLIATGAKTDASPVSGSLDGLAADRLRRPSEVAAAEWMRVHAPRNAVLLEAPGRAYSGDSRISTWTGIPTVIGWTQHEDLWRGPDPRIAARTADVETAYRTADPALRRAVLDRYGVTHVVAGDSERERYGPEVEARLRHDLSVAFTHGATTIFQVRPAP